MTETVDGYQLVAGERRLRAAQAGRPRAHPGRRPAARRREQLELALVENLQRDGPQRDRGGRRLPPADRRVRVHPGRRRDAGRPGPLDRRQHAPPPRPRAGGPGGRRRRPDHRGPRPRARRPGRRAPGPRPRLGHRPGAVRPPDRGARPTAPRAKTDAAARHRRDRPTRTSSASRRTCVARSAPRSASPDRGAAAGSSSSTTATKTSSASTSA